ncbi:DUF721 domain-containing protein [Allonocardiopsis opalescens]|uniref:Putative nucleic acid-binding Zn ribbon protein n=1 Tax=Allonocardiopsis opalescens TaxID=1144618 RepID=A0A2T0Q6Y2_9ACTN|nr:DciA family protein [Allonocardiopsis opalescens]PRX99579.1 putative nucleic acid-binding Zn ribbon protein [Allonocardiopsis opalescens]
MPEPEPAPRPDQSAPEPPAPDATARGIELARQALARAKADARERGAQPRASGRRRGGGAGRSRRAAGDPQAFGAAIADLLASRGWNDRAAAQGVFGRWDGIVGAKVAEHTRPVSLDDGVLVVAADSPAWATQVRLLAATLVRRLNEELGHGSVRSVTVRGPGRPRPQPGGRRAGGGRQGRDVRGG